MRQCHTDKNMTICNCSYEPCHRKGLCCDCLTYHRRNGELPACYFPDEVEKTYNRSVENFIRTYQAGRRWG